MRYSEALAYLFNLEHFGIKLGLQNIQILLADLGNPHLTFSSIHIAGTNGKGSTCAMIESILRAAGFRVGLYTSPHLVDFRERIQINRKLIPQQYILRFLVGNVSRIERLRATYFEVVTALAFSYFRDCQIDWGIIETGLGGRLDATNVLQPRVSVITTIGMEHTEHLGDTLEKVAAEKAGIIKCHTPVVIGRMPKAARKVIAFAARRNQAPLVDCEKQFKATSRLINLREMDLAVKAKEAKTNHYRLSLVGKHQLNNAVCALGTIQALKGQGLLISPNALKTGFATVQWSARFEIICKRPLIIADVAHNPDGAKALALAWQEVIPDQKGIIVIGVLQDKDFRQILRALFPIAWAFVVTTPETSRARPASDLRRFIVEQTKIPCHLVDKPAEAYLYALAVAGPKHPICLTGSHYTVGQILAQRG